VWETTNIWLGNPRLERPSTKDQESLFSTTCKII